MIFAGLYKKPNKKPKQIWWVPVKCFLHSGKKTKNLRPKTQLGMEGWICKPHFQH
jgi:hypothetical protein